MKIFGANFAKKTFDKKRLILWEFSGQILLEIDRILQHFVCFCEFHWILQIYLNFAALLLVKYQKPGLGLPENLSFFNRNPTLGTLDSLTQSTRLPLIFLRAQPCENGSATVIL